MYPSILVFMSIRKRVMFYPSSLDYYHTYPLVTLVSKLVIMSCCKWVRLYLFNLDQYHSHHLISVVYYQAYYLV